ncbi:MAG: ArsR/SmtB family transcription factor [Ktedonobacteraceae bacterium]
MTNSKNAFPPNADANTHHRPSQLARYIDRFLDAACDSSRRAILELLIPPDGQDSPATRELRAGEIATKLGLAPSTTSEHLRQLLNLDLVSARKEGTMVYYRLCNRHLVLAFHELLEALETHYHANNVSEGTGTEEG